MQLETPGMTPPKPKSPHPKDEVLHIRMTAAQLALLIQAADLVETPVSAWVREQALIAARRALRRTREQ